MVTPGADCASHWYREALCSKEGQIMTNVITLSKRAFTWSVVVLTIAWSVGLSALVPAAALAQSEVELEPGDLYTVPGDSAVFILTEDMEAMYFPNAEVFFTWFENFDGVNVISPEQSGAYPLADTPGVNFRPGSRLVKITTNPRVYAVGPDNMRHWIPSGEVAEELYGPAWASIVRDVHVYHWANLEDGDDVDGPHDGQLLRVDGDDNVWYVWDGQRHLVDGPVPAPAAGDVRTVSEETAQSLPQGDSVTPATILANPSQMMAGAGDDEDEDEDMDEDEEEAGPNGDLMLSLHADTPATDLVPDQATHVMYLSFNVRAGAQGGRLNSIEFMRYGLGDDSNFDKVWLEVDGLPVSQEQSVNSDDTVELRPQYNLGANQTVRFDLVANLNNADNSHQDGFEIKSADMVDANGGDVDGSFPIRGNLMNYSSYTVAAVVIDENGADDEVEIGDEQEIIGEFQLSYTSNNETDGEFRTIRLKQEGTLNMTDLANLDLYSEGESITRRVDIWGDYVTFHIAEDSMMLEDGDDRDFEVRGDVIDGEDAETIIFALEDPRDLHVREEDGFGASVSDTLIGNTNLMHTYTVDAGQFTVSLDGSSPSNENYAPDTDDVTALVARMDLGQPVQVDGLIVYIHTDSTVADTDVTAGLSEDIDNDIERAELFVNGKRIGSSLTTIGVTGADGNNAIAADEFFYNFNSSFELKDDDLITFVIDIDSTAVAGNDYKFTFDSGDFDDPEYIQTSENVPAGNLTGSAISRFVTIESASLTIVRNDGYPSGETFVGGIEDALLFQFVVNAGNATDVRAQTLVFNFGGVDDVTTYLASNYTKFTNCYLSADDGATAIANETDDLSSAGVLTFNNLRYDIEKSEQAEIGLYCDLQTGLGATSSATFTLDISASDLDDAEGNDIADASVNSNTDVPSQSLTFTDSGVLRVSVDGDTPDSDIFVADAEDADGVMLGAWFFDAEDDDIEITDLHFANLNVGGTATNTASDPRVRRYELVVDGEVVDTAQPSSGLFTFDIDDEDSRITIAKDEHVVVWVRAMMNEITEASQTHAIFRLSLYGIEAQSASPGTDLSIQPDSSSGGVTTTDGTSIYVSSVGDAPSALEGNSLVGYKTVPTIKTVPLSSDVLANGEQDIYKFSVKAHENGPVSWGSITLKVTGDCGNNTNPVLCMSTSSDFALYDQSNNSIAATFTTTSDDIVISLTSVESVAAGATRVYRVEANLDGFAAGDTASIRVRDETSAHQTAQTLTNAKADADGGANEGSFVWTDNSGSYQSTSDTHWFVGRQVDDLDTAVQSLQKPST